MRRKSHFNEYQFGQSFLLVFDAALLPIGTVAALNSSMIGSHSVSFGAAFLAPPLGTAALIEGLVFVNSFFTKKEKFYSNLLITNLPAEGFVNCVFKDCNFRVSLNKSSFEGCVFFRCHFKTEFDHVEDCFFSNCSFTFPVNFSRSHIGDYTCINNARSPFLRCAIVPDGPCDNCQYFDDGVSF
jgi:uncharacterized protein YjbI with pentapeptide repeats